MALFRGNEAAFDGCLVGLLKEDESQLWIGSVI